MRHEFDLHKISSDNGEVEAALRSRLDAKIIGASYLVDDKLLFWENHFSGRDFATYPNGFKQGGSIRYMQGTIRIPSHLIVPVYETGEGKAGKPPRALLEIPKMVVCKAREMLMSELQMDGFGSIDDMIAGMRKYPGYESIDPESMLSFYYFGRIEWNPGKGQLESFFERRK